jgi:hypothetical protein
MKVYDVIKTAEDIYINEISHLRYPGMCWCLKDWILKRRIGEDIRLTKT